MMQKTRFYKDREYLAVGSKAYLKVSSFPLKSEAEIQKKLFKERYGNKIIIRKRYGKWNTYRDEGNKLF